MFPTPPFLSQNLFIHKKIFTCSKEELDHCFLTCQVSGALTLLDIMEKHNSALATQSVLRIHIAGASIYEMMGLIKWECKYLKHVLVIFSFLSFEGGKI